MNLKEELSKFLIEKGITNPRIEITDESKTKGIIHINFDYSEATVETPSVNDNEAQKKDCNSCEHRWMPITDCCRCDPLNGYMYWQQSD